jgi:hypothetical protein
MSDYDTDLYTWTRAQAVTLAYLVAKEQRTTG